MQNFDGYDHRIGIAFQRRIPQRMVGDIAQYPDVEVGGKYVGVLRRGGAKAGTDFLARIYDYLDAGPAAIRTPTYHLPDGPYQEALFRNIEASHPDVEHLGSWHSHHPNGFTGLSSGDVEGYLKSVNSPDHNLDIFLATLLIDQSAMDQARHFVFWRGDGHFYEVHPDNISFFSTSSPYAKVLSALSHEDHQLSTRTALAPVACERSLSIALPWYQTVEGRNVLAEDRAWLMRSFNDVTSVRRQQATVIEWRATRTTTEFEIDIGLTYEEPPPATPSCRVSVIGRSSDVRCEISDAVPFLDRHGSCDQLVCACESAAAGLLPLRRTAHKVMIPKDSILRFMFHPFALLTRAGEVSGSRRERRDLETPDSARDD
jgi:hypothetical protein